MYCPVCNILIPPLQEFCTTCNAKWRFDQKDCPATITDRTGEIVATCTLPFRHRDRKHRAMGERLTDNGPEITFLWWYPDNNKHKERSEEFLRLRGAQ